MLWVCIDFLHVCEYVRKYLLVHGISVYRYVSRYGSLSTCVLMCVLVHACAPVDRYVSVYMYVNVCTYVCACLPVGGIYLCTCRCAEVDIYVSAGIYSYGLGSLSVCMGI